MGHDRSFCADLHLHNRIKDSYIVHFTQKGKTVVQTLVSYFASMVRDLCGILPPEDGVGKQVCRLCFILSRRLAPARGKEACVPDGRRTDEDDEEAAAMMLHPQSCLRHDTAQDDDRSHL